MNKEELKALIAKDELTQVVEALMGLADGLDDINLQDEIISVSSQQTAYLDASRLRTVEYASLEVKRNQIVQLLLDIIRRLPDFTGRKVEIGEHGKLEEIKKTLEMKRKSCEELSNRVRQLRDLNHFIPFVTLPELIKEINELDNTLVQINSDSVSVSRIEVGSLSAKPNDEISSILLKALAQRSEIIEKLIFTLHNKIRNPGSSFYRQQLQRILQDGRTNKRVEKMLVPKHTQTLVLNDGSSIKVGIDRVVNNIVFFYTGKGLRTLFPRNSSEKTEDHEVIKHQSEEYQIEHHYKGFLPLYMISDVY